MFLLASLTTQAQWTRNSTSGFVYPTTTTDNVRIGSNSAPNEKLHVSGNIRASGSFIIDGGQINVPGTSQSLRFAPGYIERMRIVNSGTYAGHVGIGTTNPLERLHVSGNTRTSGNFITESGIFNVSSTTNPMILQTGGAERMRIVHSGTYAGHVGIGTANPLYRLDVMAAENDWKARFQGTDGYITIGPVNPLHAHIYTDRPNFIFNKNLWSVTGGFSSYDTENLTLQTNGVTRLLVSNATGFVGVGTSTPESQLHINGQLLLESPYIFTGTGPTELNRYISLLNSPSAQSASGLKAGGVLVSDSYNYANPGKNDLIVKGKVSIGTPTTSSTNGYTLAVNGKIGAHDVQLERTSNAWPDYVFAENYQLPTLAEVERFIKENKHLKDVPSAEEIEKNGYSATGMDAVLLQKVEELTLYILQQQKQIEELRNELKALKQQ